MSDRRRFDSLIGTILKHEGGLSDVAEDPGGITHWGISLRSYPDLGPDGIRNLTVEQAKAIYYRDWWQPLRCREIKDDNVTVKLLDTAVNIGHRSAVKILQKALGNVDQLVAVDGVIGPKTVAAANRADAQDLLRHMQRMQAEHYLALIQKNPKLKKFERGWIARAYS